jgi:6-phosphogluconate dehydrogenase (decarboxylating)
MLSYHLRAPVYGDKEKTLRKRRDKGNPQTEHDGGGPIQMAITNDLIHLRERFRKKINDLSSYHQTTKNQHDNADENLHWKSGTAFLIFKDIFRSSRIAMIHLLPPALCDREAYTQLIYAACFTLFKESFEQIVWSNIDDDDEELTDNDNDNEEKKDDDDDDDDDVDSTSDSYRNHHDDAGFALFSLLALLETNPLPRQIGADNPLELIPISLRSLGDDPRSSFRRCFSQNIRIDRQHFAMLLRLKELSRAKKCDCERYFYEISKCKERQNYSKINNNTSNNKDQQGISWKCRCGMSTDILKIIEIIVPRLELCEYIGPIGVEAFAGNAYYPYKKQDNDKTTHLECNKGDHSHQSLAETEGGYSIESSSELLLSNEIVSLMGDYQKSIVAIRIPSSKLKPNAVKRLQQILEPVFNSNNNERRSFLEEPDDAAKANDSATKFPVYHATESSKYLKSLVSRKYNITLNDKIDGNLQGHLHASLMFLLKRDEPIPLQSELAHHFLSKSLLTMDDASSIGHGGISVGTNQGQVAIQNLLSAVAGRNIIRKSRSKKKLTTTEERKSTGQNLANSFLTSNQAIDSVPSSDDDDDDSVDSELTALSFSNEDGIQEDDDISVVSVATSAFGTKALEDLLQTVTQEEENDKGTKRTSVTKKPKKQKKMKIIDYNQDDETSVATSAFGTNALKDLLHTVAQQEENIGRDIITAKRTKRKSVAKNTNNQKKKRIENDHDDETSVATSAFGTKALEDLLHTVAQQEENDDVVIPAGKTKRKSVARKTKDQKKKTKAQGDEISVATSACGAHALENLLQTVAQEEEMDDIIIPAGRTKRKSVTRKTKNQKKRTKNDQDDEISVATSACGANALENLLQTVAQEEEKDDIIIPAGKIKRKSVTRKIKNQKKRIENDQDDEISVATSACGANALENLLQTVAQEEEKDDGDFSIPERRTKQRKLAPRKVKK